MENFCSEGAIENATFVGACCSDGAMENAAFVGACCSEVVQGQRRPALVVEPSTFDWWIPGISPMS